MGKYVIFGDKLIKTYSVPWLRSPGDSEDSFACVGRFGDVMEAGQWSSSEEVSARPAMWIDLNKVKEVGLELTSEK